LALAFPAAAGGREGLFYTHLVGCWRQETMEHATEYHKPVIIDLGDLMEVIQGTLIKGHTGVIEAVHWRILPAYDLDE